MSTRHRRVQEFTFAGPSESPRWQRRGPGGRTPVSLSAFRGREAGKIGHSRAIEGVRVGIDTGGTFTDVVATGPFGRRVVKLASTPDDPAEAVLAGLSRALEGATGARPAVHHGTTVATNAVLTRSGARVAFVTTRGFEDLLFIGRGARDDLHALAPTRTAPLVETRGIGVDERTDASGHVLTEPSERALAALRQAVARKKPDAVAVCLLHAVRNPANERRVLRALRGVAPFVFASHEASADPREVERAVTTVLDAYVAPVVVSYVARLAAALPRKSLTVLRSDAGRMASAEVRRAPGRTLLSGPAAGVAAARDLLVSHGIDAGLSFDVGGTSTDVAWIAGDDLPLEPTLSVGPFTSSVPALALETVGAGGGSRVTIDAGGAMRVGPGSAGAVPGPACYGQGGPFALTDAWLLLDRVPAALLGGEFVLDHRASREAAKRVAAAGRLTVGAASEGAVQVAATTTARALRRASAARGNDPRSARLVAFGGAGPVLACETADRLGVRSVLVPVDPGLFAAQGALVAPLRIDASRVAPRGGDAALRQTRANLERIVKRHLAAEGARHVRLVAEVDARYAGQAFEVTVPLARWRQRFHDAHARRYGFDAPDRPVECVRVRVRGEGREHRMAHAAPVQSVRRFRARRLARARGVASIGREVLGVGERLVGPCRIDETTGTTWVPAGWQADVLGDHTLGLRRRS